MSRLLRVVTLILISVMVLGLVLSGCSSSSPETQPASSNSAPDFQLDNLRGEAVSLAQFRGKPVLLNFWASWCGPCRQEMPFLQEIYENQELQDTGLVILAVNIGESPATAERFMEAGGFSFPVLLDIDNSVAGKYNVRGIPATFFTCQII